MTPTLGPRCPIDVPRLLETRLLVQSNSGGGKSWALRRLLEQTAKDVQQLVIDPEGEFATLRERFDYVICAPSDADAIANPRTAALLARRLLETGVSAILNIYDLKAHERTAFVRRFLESLINAPKRLWRPVLVVLDEAHNYCPQKGEAESAGAVIDVATRGRKRGFGLCLATQRLSKLHKDAAAELLNKLIGRTSLDIDVSRAAEELGLSKREGIDRLRALSPGDFYVFGPALVPDVTTIQVGTVETTHPRPGDRLLAPPPAPSERVRKILGELADLPKQAEDEARTLSEMRREVTRLKRALSAAERKGRTHGLDERTAKEVTDKVWQAGYEQGQRESVARHAATLDSLDAALDRFAKEVRGIATLDPSRGTSKPPPLPRVNHGARKTPAARQVATNDNLPKGERAVLTVAAQYLDGATREQITILSGYKRSTRDAYIQRLRERGFVTVEGGEVSATDAGIEALGSDFEPLPTGDALRDYWLGRLPEGEARILQATIDAYPDGLPRDVLGHITDYKRSTRDAYIQRLKARRLVSTNTGGIKASGVLFD